MVELSEGAKSHASAYDVSTETIQEAAQEAVECLSREPEGAWTALRIEAPWGVPYVLGATELPVGVGGHYLVTITREEERYAVTGAHVVPADLDLVPREEGEPLEMLRKLAQSKYGLPVSVWGHKGTYIHPTGQEAILVAPEGEEDVAVRQEAPDRVPAVQRDVRRLDDGSGRVFLAFAVDATAVQEAVCG